MHGFADEEAAKVLVLVDYVRCPRNLAQQRLQVLKRFHGHVAKRIHAEVCEYPGIASFRELRDLVERECRPWYLDGPNGFDWIFPNPIMEKRERGLYVDYVRDMTTSGAGVGECFWIGPAPALPVFSRYQASACVTLVRLLRETGAFSTDGLAEIANVWRGFVPAPETDRGELQKLIVKTLRQLVLRSGTVDEDAKRFIVSHWPFPLWSLRMEEPRLDEVDLDLLREEQTRAVEWLEVTLAKRDPPPAISRAKVEEISEAHAAWQSDVEARAAHTGGSDGGRMRFSPVTDSERWFDLVSYGNVKRKLAAMSDEERTALIALGWFAHDRVVDWPWIYEHAIKMYGSTLSENYQIGLGSYWLSGLNRWESKPVPFSAGER